MAKYLLPGVYYKCLAYSGGGTKESVVKIKCEETVYCDRRRDLSHCVRSRIPNKMTTDLLPDMSLPYALVITTDMGASPEKVESDVTAPVEASMATTSSIKNVSSASYDNYSMVILEYEQNANMDSVIIEIQQKLDQLEAVFRMVPGSR